ncbi:hypothetical protein F0U59_10240 [Archangium gephyra]|nr:hypothetical protein F0U59_10240 [Archangium gephyra]
MTITQSLLTFLLAAGVLTITPGVDTVMVLRTATLEGPRRAVFAALGIGLGCLVWGAAVALGLGAFVASYTFLLAAIHVVLGLLWGVALIAASVPLGRTLSRPSVVRALDRLTGCVFIAFGARLALARR